MKKSHGNDKLLEKITSSNYHMEQKIFIEASCIYMIKWRQKLEKKCFIAATFEGLWVAQVPTDFSTEIEGIRTLVFFFTNFEIKKTQIQLVTNLKGNLAH